MEKEKRKDHCHIQWAKKLCGLSFFVISPIYSIKYIIYHITILIVELHRLVCIAFLEVVLRCSCHSTCLRSLQAAVIAAEALAIHIVVIVLAIVRHCKGNANREQYKMNSFIFIAEMQLTLSKGCIIILDNLQLPGIFSFIINIQAVSFITYILDAAWI